MFTYIESVGRAGRLRRARPQLSKIVVPRGSPFYVLRASERVPLRELFRIAGRCAPTVLTDLPIPPQSPVRRFEPCAYPLRRAACVLLRLLREAALPPRNLAIGVRDENAALRGKVCAFLPFAADVRVVTRDVCAFDADARRAAREWGALITVGENSRLLDGCVIVLNTTIRTTFGLSAAPQPAVLPEAYAARRPPSLDVQMFAAALSELCGVREAERWIGNGVTLNGSACSFAEAAALLRAQYVEN